MDGSTRCCPNHICSDLDSSFGKVGYYAVVVGIFTALLTSIYSWRLIFKTFHGNYNNEKLKINAMHESPFVMLIPLIILAIGEVFAGILFKGLFIGHEMSYNFWGSSIKFLEPLSKAHPPTWFKFLTPIFNHKFYSNLK